MARIEKARTLGDIARLQAQTCDQKTALIFEGQEVSYRELDRRTNQAANGLLKLGVLPDERIGYLGKNSLCYFELLIAASKAAAVTVPLNWRLAPPELAFIIANAGCNVVFVAADFASALRDSLAGLNANEITLIDADDYESWLTAQQAEDPAIRVAYEADVLQLYTSGTTGRPKGVRISNRALLSGRAREYERGSPVWNQWQSDDVSLIAMPCFHIGGTGFGLSTLYAGATGVIMRQFDAKRLLDLMVKHRITKQFIVPAALRSLLHDERIRSADLSSLRYISYGASPIPLDLMKACIDVLGCGFVQKYGMTETSGTCVALGPEDHTIPENIRMKSVGKPLAGAELRIVDKDGVEVPVGVTGEVVIKSPTNMSGYWKDEGATAQAYLADGWLRTGDAGFLDEDGYLFLRDRIKDMIVSGGENVYPAEVEATLHENPIIAEAAVIGVPDAKWGEAVKACVVLRPGEVADADAIIAHCRARIAGYKTPKSIDFLSALPRNASGKTLKAELRAPYWIDQERAIH